VRERERERERASERRRQTERVQAREKWHLIDLVTHLLLRELVDVVVHDMVIL